MLFQAGSLLLVIISVYLLKRIHIFSDKSYKVVQGLVFNLTLPCAIIMSFATNKHPMNPAVACRIRLICLPDSVVRRVFRIAR